MFQRIQKLVKREWAGIAFRQEVQLELPHPVVSFTFDDVPASGFENGGRILTEHGFVGTFYVSQKFLNADDPVEYFTREHLSIAVENGHELGCHTHGHIQLSRTPLETSIHDLKNNRRAFRSLLPNLRLSNFSYPFGEQTLAIKKHLSRTYRSARGVGQAINCGQTDLFNLKTIRLYEAQYPLDFIFKKLDEAERCNGWLIFYTHDVKENPSSWGCSPQYFEAVVQETANRQLAVMTVNEALDFIEMKTARPPETISPNFNN